MALPVGRSTQHPAPPRHPASSGHGAEAPMVTALRLKPDPHHLVFVCAIPLHHGVPQLMGLLQLQELLPWGSSVSIPASTLCVALGGSLQGATRAGERG